MSRTSWKVTIEIGGQVVRARTAPSRQPDSVGLAVVDPATGSPLIGDITVRRSPSAVGRRPAHGHPGEHRGTIEGGADRPSASCAVRFPSERRAVRSIRAVRARAFRSGLSSYVKRRMNRLRGELKGRESLTIQCPDCEQMAFVAAPGGGTCHFSGKSWPVEGLLIEDYLGVHPDLEATARACPQCEAGTLVQGLIFADSPGVYDMWHCFTCTARYTARELVACAGCDRPWPIEADTE